MVIFTHDLDFGSILANTRRRRPSVIQARVEDLSPEMLGPTMLRVLRQFTSELKSGAIVTVLPDRNRVRLLPL
jgi:predicted nuclease of predicted toxin-antitoxin system